MRRTVKIFALVVTVLSLGYVAGFNWGYSGWAEGTPVLNKGFYQETVIGVVFKERFTLCGHELPLSVSMNISGVSRSRLVELYPPDLWSLRESLPGFFVLTRLVEGLCPEDERKRHFGIVDDKIVVIKGPAGVDGGLDFITNIETGLLPQWWLPTIGETTFASIGEALSALDSLDEYL